jgi:hypothetical protein
MAFNFLGTLSSGQFVELSRFLTYQKEDIEDRYWYLNGELRRVGFLTVTFDTETGYITAFQAGPPTSLLGKLVTAYKLLGGNPLRDLPIRTFTDPIFMNPGSSTKSSKQFSNKREKRSSFHQDSLIGMYMGQLKEWAIGAITYKREDLEFKIKKLVDWSDQLFTELFVLDVVGNISGLATGNTETASTGAPPRGIPAGLVDWVESRLREIPVPTVTDPRQKTMILAPFADMLKFVTDEVYSGTYPSVTNNDQDIYGLTAGKIINSFNVDPDQVVDPIPVANK